METNKNQEKLTSLKRRSYSLMIVEHEHKSTKYEQHARRTSNNKHEKN
jgi:hypothetical protein